MFKVNDEEIKLTSIFNTWTYLAPCSSISIVNFEQVNVDWEYKSIIDITCSFNIPKINRLKKQSGN